MEPWIDPFLAYLGAELNLSPATVKRYIVDLAQFQAFIEEQNPECSWTAVEAADVREWVIYLLDECRISPASVKGKLGTLRGYYKYLLRMNLVGRNPLERVVAPKCRRKLPSFVKEGEMDRLLEIMGEDTSFEGVRNRLIVLMFYTTGIRRAELVGLKDADVSTTAKQLKVLGKGNKHRIVPFGNELESSIRDYLAARSEAVGTATCEAFFVDSQGRGVSYEFVGRVVKDSLSKVTTIGKRTPHVLRHTFATAMLNNKADLFSIQKLLGHASVATTEIYTHVSFEEMKDAYKNAHPRR